MEKAVSGTSLDPVGTLKEMNSLGVQVVNADGSVNVDRINNYVQMKVASAPKATTPEAAPATPTLPISPIDQPNPTMANPSAPASTGDTIADINAAGGIWGVYKNATAPKKGTK